MNAGAPESGLPVRQALAAAERRLRSITGAALEGSPDPRWQAIIQVGDFVATHPDEVWAFASRWGCSGDRHLRSAVGACLIEPLLHHHFPVMFPRVKELASRDPKFADTVRRSWSFGETWHPGNLRQWRDFQESLHAADVVRV